MRSVTPAPPGGGYRPTRRDAHAIATGEKNLDVTRLVSRNGDDVDGRQLHASRSPPGAPQRPILARQPLPPVIQGPRRHAVLLGKRSGAGPAVTPLASQLQPLV